MNNMGSFFDNYDLFFASSKAGGPQRLRYRYQLLFKNSGVMFDGKRVIDIGSHDCRWSFCALKHGASYVLGIEAHSETIESGLRNFQAYEIPEYQYKFLCGDVFKVFQQIDESQTENKFEIGMVLGFMYHTTRHFETIENLVRLGCKTLLVETQVMQDEKDTKVKYRKEEVGPAHTGFSETGVTGGQTISAIPSVSAMRLMLETFGFQTRIVIIPQCPVLAPGDEDFVWDFRIGRRICFVAEKK